MSVSGHNLALRPTGPYGPGVTTASASWATAPSPRTARGPACARPDRDHPGLRHREQLRGALGRDAVRLGQRLRGQLGTGTSTGTFLRLPSPTPVPGLTGVTQVSAGFFHTLALANNVTWAWGFNASGELGDRTETERDSPEQILFGPATQVAAGYLDSAVARPDGSLVVWGDGTLNPVVYVSLTGVTQVSLGHGINLVLGQSAFVAVPNLTGDSTAAGRRGAASRRTGTRHREQHGGRLLRQHRHRARPGPPRRHHGTNRIRRLDHDRDQAQDPLPVRP